MSCLGIPSMYPLLRRLLFTLPPETSHDLSLDLFGAAERLKLLPFFTADPVYDPVVVMGIEFPNPVGLAAGLDKNGDYFNALGELGFGFVEIGTVTPRPQPGNPQPRMFRLPKANAIINRMGFNNKGVEHLCDNVKHRRYAGVLGINIGKNVNTPIVNAVDDYRTCMRAVYPHADYIVVNVSSPNTPGLRSLQYGDELNSLLRDLKFTQEQLADKHGRSVPLAVKIAPDMDDDAIQDCAQVFVEQAIDAVIATNTTIDRDAVAGLPHGDEQGGLSGAPLLSDSNALITSLNGAMKGAIPIIGVGGIMTPQDAVEKIQAGASLVQLYSGLVYTGPSLVASAAKAILAQR